MTMTKALTLRIERGVYEALRQEAFDARLPISEIIRTAINVHLNDLFKMRNPSRFCDWRGCTASAVGITTPGGFRFCDELLRRRVHLPKERTHERALRPERKVGRMKTTPDNDFAVVRDRERRMVVHAGNYAECSDLASSYNNLYQSTAYVAELWKDHAHG